MTTELRCDLCNEKGNIAWTHVTPRTADSLLEATLTGRYWCDDEEWAVCADCHPFIERGDKVGLYRRSLEQQTKGMLIFGDSAGELKMLMESEIARVHETFWIHLDPRGGIAEPGYRVPRDG